MKSPPDRYAPNFCPADRHGLGRQETSQTKTCQVLSYVF